MIEEPVEEPVAEDPEEDEPVGEDPAEEEDEEPVVADPIDNGAQPADPEPNEPVAEEPEDDQSGQDEAGVNDPAQGDPITTDPQPEEPVEEPVAEEPAPEPEPEEPTEEDPVETDPSGSDDNDQDPVEDDDSGTQQPAEPPLVTTVESQIDVIGGRVATIRPDGANIVSVKILDRPEHGQLSVNPDNSLALVLTRSNLTGPLNFAYEAVHSDGSITQHIVQAEVAEGPQKAGWGTSEAHYMLATDANDKVIVEHGDNHRKVYVTGSEKALTAADIAAREGMSESAVTARWLRDHGTEYGASEDMALSTDLAMSLWSTINPCGGANSNWLLFERGYEYDAARVVSRGASGESELHPLFIGAWGEGDKPVLQNKQMIFQSTSKNIVLQDLDFSAGVSVLAGGDGPQENIIFDGTKFSNEESNVQGAKGVTFRNSSFTDAWREEPGSVTADGKWAAHRNRESGLYMDNTEGALFDRVLFDHNGWAPDFLSDASIDGGHPPSMYSQGLYLQHSVIDVSMHDSVIMRSASVGAQYRGGAFVENTLFIDNNVALNTNGGGGGVWTGNYSLLLGNLVTHAAGRGEGLPQIGATDWGIGGTALYTSLVGNIVAHAGNPHDESDARLGSNGIKYAYEDGIYFDDSLVWGWRLEGNGSPDSQNTDGLDPSVLNEATIHRYVETLANGGVPVNGGQPHSSDTIQAFAEHLRALDGSEYSTAVQDVLDWFRERFGIEVTEQPIETTFRFVPDDRGHGVRWDNRLNWDQGVTPGRDGDSIDLGGKKVVFGGTVRVEDLDFGAAGGLILAHGKLTVDGKLLAGDEGATLDISRAGQFWTNGSEGGGLLEISVDGGRFANTGTFLGPVELTATAGQTILATDGAVFAASAGSRIEVVGYEARVGFDGGDGGMAFLGFDTGATLAFTATAGGLGGIATFRSGAFGDAPDVLSGVDLGNATLEIDLSALTADVKEVALLRAEELVGTFGDIVFRGLGGRDAEIVIDYAADAVWLRLMEGSGLHSLERIGSEDMFDTGHEDLWQALMGGAATAHPDHWDM
ncbi:hypothetical protein [Pararhodobacter sp. SW119]|uniref:hypothetical protein n=1 Tax=Pararhodobacter sp. SW119 TaxID=2780075 RepID=UPI001AE0A854|nr:hypothetical protein [Pararhodobacter sp. SW119]